MSVVVINAVTVPAGMREVFEERFAQRKGAVERSEGFEEFQLLRPQGDDGRYFVYTRWATQEAYEAWLSSQSFAQAHGGERRAPVASDSELLTFEVIQRVAAGDTAS